MGPETLAVTSHDGPPQVDAREPRWTPIALGATWVALAAGVVVFGCPLVSEGTPMWVDSLMMAATALTVTAVVMLFLRRPSGWAWSALAGAVNVVTFAATEAQPGLEGWATAGVVAFSVLTALSLVMGLVTARRRAAAVDEWRAVADRAAAVTAAEEPSEPGVHILGVTSGPRSDAVAHDEPAPAQP